LKQEKKQLVDKCSDIEEAL
jgi:hypothetical protein